MMAYVLVTEDGQFMKFYIQQLAELYQLIYGGQVVKITDLDYKKQAFLAHIDS